MEALPLGYILCAKIVTEPRDGVEGFVKDEDIGRLLTDEKFRSRTIHEHLLNVLTLEDHCDYDTLSCLLTMLTYTSNLRGNPSYKPSARFNSIVSNFVSAAPKEGIKKAYNTETKVRKLADVCYTQTLKLYKKNSEQFVNTFNRLNAICFGRIPFVVVLCEFMVVVVADNVRNNRLLINTLLNMSCIADKVPMTVINTDTNATEIIQVSPFSSVAEVAGPGISLSIGNLLREILNIDPLGEMFQFFLRADLDIVKVIRLLEGTRNMYQLSEYLKGYLARTPVTLEMIKDVGLIKSFDRRQEVVKLLFSRYLDPNPPQKELCIILCRMEDLHLLTFMYESRLISDQFGFTLGLIEILSRPKKSGLRSLEFVLFVLQKFNQLFLESEDPDIKGLIKGKVSVIIDVMIESRLTCTHVVTKLLEMHPIDSYKEKTIVRLISNSDLPLFQCLVSQMTLKLIHATMDCLVGNEKIVHRTEKLRDIIEKIVENIIDNSLTPTDDVLEALLQYGLSDLIFKHSVLTQSIGLKHLEKNITDIRVISLALDCVHFDCSEFIPTIFLRLTLLYRDDVIRDHLLPSIHYKKSLTQGSMTQELSDRYLKILEGTIFKDL
jgi:hypothetical protein